MNRILTLALLLFGVTPMLAADLTLSAGSVQIVISDREPAPLRLAAETLAKDFEKVTGAKPKLVGRISAEKSDAPVLVVVNRETNALKLPLDGLRPLDGFESHRVWADPAANRIYLDGADMRGAIYAIYTFSEQILGVPPLWYWCSWVPEKKRDIHIPDTYDQFIKSPQVRFRAWFPNDTDLFSPWRKLSWENNELWLETMLRLKLNTAEIGNSIAYPGMTSPAKLFGKYGLVLTSHHVVTLNTTVTEENWNKYWKRIRGREESPARTLANEKELLEFWDYAAKTVAESGIENLWNIGFRGDGDKPFWSTFKDAPATEPERAEVINRMLLKQMEIIRKYSKEANPYVRITFYDEMADLIAAGLVKPPANENMIWTFCSGRRDHYPYTDIQQFNPATPVKLGYYMNFQFTSTGSHLAPAEGPWKMEFNYRYVNGKSPLYFSVINAGNLREYVYEMSANAKMLWDYSAYDSDRWNREYAAQYFGEVFADEIAGLYKDFFHAYWTQRASDFPGGMERQFIFQDQRYSRAIRYIADVFFSYDPNPLPDLYGHERVPGRVFRVIPADNGADNQVDAMLNGMNAAIPKFADVTRRCETVYGRLPKEKQQFFYDNLLAYSRFMEHVSRSLYHYVYAYKHQTDKQALLQNLDSAYAQMEKARDVLYENQHGVFGKWYAGEKHFGLEANLERIDTTRKKARSK